MENANGLGRLLARQMVDHDQQVRDVPAKLAARVRSLEGSGHKTDAHDARSTVIAGRRATVLRDVVPDGTPELLGLLIERRWQIVSARQKTLVRIHQQLTDLVEGGVPRGLSADKTARVLRTIRPSDPVAARRREVVKELLAELRVVIIAELERTLAEHRTALTEIDGIGRVAAAMIIAITGDVHRFPTAGHHQAADVTTDGHLGMPIDWPLKLGLDVDRLRYNSWGGGSRCRPGPGVRPGSGFGSSRRFRGRG